MVMVRVVASVMLLCVCVGAERGGQHAVSGGRLEVMGVLQGKIEGDTMVVMDSFALPVEGTETRVNAAAEGLGSVLLLLFCLADALIGAAYMIQYLEACEKTNKEEPGLGWYHSHPGYGCWLSGIDVDTQNFNQKFQDPWLAIVVDPVRTIAQGKVEQKKKRDSLGVFFFFLNRERKQVQLGAFRTYPDDYKPPESESSYQSVPMDKVK